MAKENNQEPQKDSLEEPSTVIQPTNQTHQADQEEVKAEDQTLVADTQNRTETKPPTSPSGFKRVLRFVNIYFIIFLVLLAAAGVTTFVSLKSNDNKPKQNKTQSLTDKQIAELRGSTTIVGDAQQTLDIQGNSIFEGQVLMRNNLDVAGSIKVGGSLSLPAITVGGSSSFGQIRVNQTLSVNGNTTLQGQLSVQKALSVAGSATIGGSLSANQLNVSTLRLTGDLVIARHITLGGGAPSRSGGPALGAGGTVSVNGTDTAGTVTINTGGGPPAGCFVTINFTQKFNTTPHVVISPSNSNAGSLNYYTNRSNINFSICTANGPSSSRTYIFDYIIID